MAGPVVLDGYPAPEERSCVYLGAPVEAILRARRVRLAIGTVKLRAWRGQAAQSQDELDAWIEADFRDRDRPSNSAHKCFVTIVVERHIEVSDELVTSARFAWLDASEALRLDREFEAYASPFIDRIAAFSTTVLSPALFEEVVLDKHVFFASEERETFGLPRSSATAHASLGMPEARLEEDRDNLERLLRAVTSPSGGRQDWIKGVAHWRLAATSERDRWKQFYWRFLALEALARELYTELLPDAVARVRSGVVPESLASVVERIGEPRTVTDPPIRSKFAVLALALDPTEAEQDAAAFRQVNEARAGMSHGRMVEPDRLPIGPLDELLRKYLSLAVNRQVE